MRSCRAIPSASAARRSARARRAGCTVAPSRKRTPRGSAASAPAPRPARRRAARTPPGRRAPPRRADALIDRRVLERRGETLRYPPSRSQTSSPRASENARTAGTIRSDRRQSSSAAASPISRASRGEVRPVAVQEAAVPPARPPADDLLLEHGDAQRRIALPERERRPEARVAAADDRDVDLGSPESGRRIVVADLGPPTSATRPDRSGPYTTRSAATASASRATRVARGRASRTGASGRRRLAS